MWLDVLLMSTHYSVTCFSYLWLSALLLVFLAPSSICAWNLDIENSANYYNLAAFSLSETIHPVCIHTHTCLMALFPGLPRRASTRKVKPIWILLKQETVSGSGISWAICKSAPCFRQITMPAAHHSVLDRPNALPAAKPTVSKHWRQSVFTVVIFLPSAVKRYGLHLFLCWHCQYTSSSLVGLWTELWVNAGWMCKLHSLQTVPLKPRQHGALQILYCIV